MLTSSSMVLAKSYERNWRKTLEWHLGTVKIFTGKKRGPLGFGGLDQLFLSYVSVKFSSVSLFFFCGGGGWVFEVSSV